MDSVRVITLSYAADPRLWCFCSRRGAKFLPNLGDECHRSPFALLVGHGFTLLVKRICMIEAESVLGQGDWHAFGDRSKAELWYANRPAGESQWEGRLCIPAIQRRRHPEIF